MSFQSFASLYERQENHPTIYCSGIIRYHHRCFIGRLYFAGAANNYQVFWQAFTISIQRYFPTVQ